MHDVTVGAQRDGTLGGLRVRGWADVGAYPVRGTFIPLVTRFMSAGVYRWQRHDLQRGRSAHERNADWSVSRRRPSRSGGDL